MTHTEPHSHSNQLVAIIDPHTLVPTGELYRIEDWYDRLGQGTWIEGVGNFACMKYAKHVSQWGLPLDNEVVYGKINGLGYLYHVSELGIS
jgi:hypothetical protein